MDPVYIILLWISCVYASSKVNPLNGAWFGLVFGPLGLVCACILSLGPEVIQYKEQKRKEKQDLWEEKERIRQQKIENDLRDAQLQRQMAYENAEKMREERRRKEQQRKDEVVRQEQAIKDAQELMDRAKKANINVESEI